MLFRARKSDYQNDRGDDRKYDGRPLHVMTERIHRMGDVDVHAEKGEIGQCESFQ